MTDLFDDDAVRKRAALALAAPVAERAASAGSDALGSGERRDVAVQATSEQGAPSEAVGRRSVPLTFGARQTQPASHQPQGSAATMHVEVPLHPASHQPQGSAATMHVEVPLHTANGVVMVDPRKLRMQDHRDNGRAIFRALCMARACPSCGTRHVAFKCTPPEALCLTCSLAEQARQEAKARDRAPALPGL